MGKPRVKWKMVELQSMEFESIKVKLQIIPLPNTLGVENFNSEIPEDPGGKKIDSVALEKYGGGEHSVWGKQIGGRRNDQAERKRNRGSYGKAKGLRNVDRCLNCLQARSLKAPGGQNREEATVSIMATAARFV